MTPRQIIQRHVRGRVAAQVFVIPERRKTARLGQDRPSPKAVAVLPANLSHRFVPFLKDAA